jgi:hypothetical protein
MASQLPKIAHHNAGFCDYLIPGLGTPPEGMAFDWPRATALGFSLEQSQIEAPYAFARSRRSALR